MWKVMLADDEPYIREGLEKLISWKELGCELVFQAKNGKELIEKMEETRPDIVIVDIKMPVMGGLEVAAYLEERGWPVKVIVLTAYADFEYARQALRYKVCDYVMKTAALDEIPPIVERITKELKEDKLTSYQMILLNGVKERDKTLVRILNSYFDQQIYTGSPVGEEGYYIILLNHLYSQEELTKRCRKVLEVVGNFMGQKPAVCISRMYYDEEDTSKIYDQTWEYMVNHEGQRAENIMLIKEEQRAANRAGCEHQEEKDAGRTEEEVTDLVEKTQHLIEKNFCSRLTLVELAGQVHANPSYLSRLYKQKTGDNLFDVINRMRIEKAKAYIEEQNKKIYEIAELVGFEDTAYFSRVFKKLAGVSPKEYDKRCRSGRSKKNGGL